MPLQVYMDVHVPLAVTEGARRRRVDVITSQDDGTTQIDDEALFARASELGRLLFTQDEDLFAIAASWQRVGTDFVGILDAHQQGSSLGGLVNDIELLVMCASAEELANRVTYLPL